MIANLDSDILVYRVGWASEDVEEEIAKWRLFEAIKNIQDALETNDFNCYLTSTDKSNFRYKLFPEYKANRTQPKPKHYEFLRNVFLTELKAEEAFGQEADDLLGINQNDNTILCSIDKDLDQIPGWHYNFVTLLKYRLSTLEAMRCFYMQCLVGDKSTDNIEGCPRIGKVKANKMTEGCENEQQLLETVIKAYSNAYPKKEWADRLLLAGNLLWVRKKPNQSWELSSGEVVSKLVLEHFLKLMELDLDTSPEESPTSCTKSTSQTLS